MPFDAWLTEVLPGRRIVRARVLSGGFRNENIELVTAWGERFVLRRFRHGDGGAVEAALAARLAGVVPVPEVIAVGDGVLLSRFAPGMPLSAALSVVDPVRLGHAVGSTLAAVGTVGFERPGFFGDTLEPDGSEPTADLPRFVERCLRDSDALSPAEQDALLGHATRCAALLTEVRGSRQLVHSDYNPKNLLVDEHGAVTAVLGWEFALASSPLIDIGNMLRFPDELPAAYPDAFIAGFAEAGGWLPDNWREISQALDLFALAEFLTRPPEHLFLGKAVAVLRRRLHIAN